MRFDEIRDRIDRNREGLSSYIRESGIRFERFMQQVERRMEPA